MIGHESEMRYQGDPRASIAGIPGDGPFQPNPTIRTPITPDPSRTPIVTPRQPSAPKPAPGRESSPPRTGTPRPIGPGDSPGRPS